MSTDEDDLDWGIAESQLTAPLGFNMRNYQQLFQMFHGEYYCHEFFGEPCKPCQLKYDEHFRFDVVDPQNATIVRRFFHRGISTLEKVSARHVRLFEKT